MKFRFKKTFDVFTATRVVWVVTKILKFVAPSYFGVKQSYLLLDGFTLPTVSSSEISIAI